MSLVKSSCPCGTLGSKMKGKLEEVVEVEVVLPLPPPGVGGGDGGGGGLEGRC